MASIHARSATETPPPPPVAVERSKGISPSSTNHIRIARPSKSLAAAERFWTDGLGLHVLWRASPVEHVESCHELLMLGWKDAAWHLELVEVSNDDSGDQQPRPTGEDLLVLYLEGPVEGAVIENLVKAGGKRVKAKNPYWNTWGVTIEDPDGYRVVLCQRKWSNRIQGVHSDI